MNAQAVSTSLYALADQMDSVARDMEALFNEKWAAPTYSSDVWELLLRHYIELQGAALQARNWADHLANMR